MGNKKHFKSNIGTAINCGGGIDFGLTLVTKIGKGRDINNQDLVWVGKASNYASHLSNEANNTIVISIGTFNKLNESRKVYNGKQMWQPKVITLKNGTKVNCYESEWCWVIS